MTTTRQWHLDADLAAVAAILCQPVAWPRFLPHVPRAALRPDGLLALTTTWRGVRIPTVCSVEKLQSMHTFTLTLHHQQGLLRGLDEMWQAQEPEPGPDGDEHLVLSLTTTWTGKPQPLRRQLAERLYLHGVLPRTVAQLMILAESDWRSRGISVRQSS